MKMDYNFGVFSQLFYRILKISYLFYVLFRIVEYIDEKLEFFNVIFFIRYIFRRKVNKIYDIEYVLVNKYEEYNYNV